MRVLIIVDSGTVSGPVRQLGAVIPPLIECGHEIHCITFQRAGHPSITSPAFLENLGATVTTLLDRSAFDLSLVAKLVRAVRDLAPDLVETHNYRPAVLMAVYRLSRRLRVPWIGYFHGSTNESRIMRLYNRLDHWALRHADEVVVMSLRQRLEKQGYAAPVRVLYNAAIPDVADSQADDKTLNEPLDAPHPRIGVVGRLSHEKGVDVALAAWEKLVADGFEGSLVIAGDGPERERLEAQAATSSLLGRVVFLGHVQRIQNLYPELDMLLIPSRSEGLPNTFLEALQYPHLAIVSTRVGAIPELAEGNCAVTLANVGDIQALANGIRTALAAVDSPERNAARLLLLSKVKIETRVRAIREIYSRVVGSI